MGGEFDDAVERKHGGQSARDWQDDISPGRRERDLHECDDYTELHPLLAIVPALITFDVGIGKRKRSQ